MSDTSIWRGLHNPVYRRLWIASIISGCCVSAQDTAATWIMNTITSSSFLISAMSTVAALPFFFFTLPAGALADMIDRRKLLIWINVWLSAAAAALGVLEAVHVLDPALILICVFAIGAGFAFYAPAWSAVIPELVTKEELPSALTLGGVQMNISGIIGPALGGLLLPLFGAQAVFGLNSVCFFVLVIALSFWRPTSSQSKVPLESFLESFASAIRYVRYAPGMQVVLARDVLFAVFIAAIPALLPVVGLRELHLGSTHLGMLFTSMGIGSVVCAMVIIPRARAHYSPNTLTILATSLLGAVFLLMVWVRDTNAFLLVAALAGVSWTLTASELWVAGQRAMPAWARGRMNATHMMVSQGGMALGGLVWGALASSAGIQFALLAATLLLFLSLGLAVPLSINFANQLNTDPAPLTTVHHRMLHAPEPHDGPVAVSMEFDIREEDRAQFLELMREVRLINLRNGASSWRLDEDLEKRNRFRTEMIIASWSEHLHQHERMTRSELDIWERTWKLNAGNRRPVVKHYLSITRELLPRRTLLPVAPAVNIKSAGAEMVSAEPEAIGKAPPDA